MTDGRRPGERMGGRAILAETTAVAKAPESETTAVTHGAETRCEINATGGHAVGGT